VADKSESIVGKRLVPTIDDITAYRLVADGRSVMRNPPPTAARIQNEDTFGAERFHFE
jgi:hypothetical protein